MNNLEPADHVTVVTPQTQDTPQRFGMSAFSEGDEIFVYGNTWHEALDALKEAAQQRWPEEKQ